MTEARHDQAVALLTASSPTIVLLVEREGAEQLSEGDAPGVPRARMHSPPPPPGHGDSPPEETPSLPRNHLSRGLEDQYPIEVSGSAGIWDTVILGIFHWKNGSPEEGWPAVVIGVLRSGGEPLCPVGTYHLLTHVKQP